MAIYLKFGNPASIRAGVVAAQVTVSLSTTRQAPQT